MIQEVEKTQATHASRTLDAFFAPASVAVIGATDRPKSVGRTVIENLLTGRFPGPIYPVNPKRNMVASLHCYPNVEALPPVDLAFTAAAQLASPPRAQPPLPILAPVRTTLRFANNLAHVSDSRYTHKQRGQRE